MFFVGQRIRHKETGMKATIVKAGKYPNGWDKFLIRVDREDAHLDAFHKSLRTLEYWIDGKDKTYVSLRK